MPDIHHAILIGAPVEKLYNAITSEGGLSAWWTPYTTTNAVLNSLARFHFGPDYFKEMKITQLIPDRLVRWSCIAGAAEWIGTDICFELMPSGKESLVTSYPEMTGQVEQQADATLTILRFRHNNWQEQTLMFAECSYTWALFLRSLKLFCETGTGRPWPGQHLS